VKNAGYEQARGGIRASGYAIGGDQFFDRFNVGCHQISANDKVSELVLPGCWRVLTFHAIGSKEDGWAPITEEQFETLMAELARYRDDGALEILPFKSAVARLQ
jgi:hypothetical protein